MDGGRVLQLLPPAAAAAIPLLRRAEERGRGLNGGRGHGREGGGEKEVEGGNLSLLLLHPSPWGEEFTGGGGGGGAAAGVGSLPDDDLCKRYLLNPLRAENIFTGGHVTV